MAKRLKEIWLPVDGWYGYEVSNLGRIRSKNSRYYNLHPHGQVLKSVLCNNKYYKVTLCARGFRKDLLVHRLVATAFHGPPTPEAPDVNHKNFIKTDNRDSNLEWVSKSGNDAHAVAAGRKFIPPIHAPESMARGARHGMAKLKDKQVLEIRRLSSQGISAPKLAAKFGVGIPTIYKIKYRQGWRHI